MENPEVYEFKTNKIYCISYGNDWAVVRFIKRMKFDDRLFLCMTPAEEGFGYKKNMYLDAKTIFQIFEFESLAEYQEHYDRWRDDERTRRFTGDEWQQE